MEELEEEARVALEAASREGERGGGEPQLSRLADVRAEAVRGADAAGARLLLVRELGEAVLGAAERREQPGEVLWLG